MKVRRATRYHCDHCNRGYWTKRSAQIHERTCFFAAVRDCPTCEKVQIVKEDLDLVPQDEHETDSWPGWVNRVSVNRDGCPKCILAAITQIAKRDGMKRYNVDDVCIQDLGFDYEVAHKAFAERRVREDAINKEPPPF